MNIPLIVDLTRSSASNSPSSSVSPSAISVSSGPLSPDAIACLNEPFTISSTPSVISLAATSDDTMSLSDSDSSTSSENVAFNDDNIDVIETDAMAAIQAKLLQMNLIQAKRVAHQVGHPQTMNLDDLRESLAQHIVEMTMPLRNGAPLDELLIIGIDPGTARLGWTVCVGSANGFRVLTAGLFSCDGNVRNRQNLGYELTRLTEIIFESTPPLPRPIETVFVIEQQTIRGGPFVQALLPVYNCETILTTLAMRFAAVTVSANAKSVFSYWKEQALLDFQVKLRFISYTC
ncbi:hypothetical protein BCR33DRAFT_715004 [Rhizoclosmatium globosum]|uniref:Holliday junction resolvase RuvC n=1 Tax=Rhizoclosmatium globosum TaxID=329046 RepID=A0A1Y2CJP9_9FUNG|nr:hypothetical protein BCR33DRAFT_715004 [Rhizoclosmatium globosum]|eukprot:ORY47251.1 hypothetical protein BCR33DRAFT_715004 [Rhizoclosmatium globosum]